MDQFLLSLQAIPGFSPVLIVIGLVMILKDIRKLYKLAIEPQDKKKKPDLKFYFVIPGLFFFAFGYHVMMAVAPQ